MKSSKIFVEIEVKTNGKEQKVELVESQIKVSLKSSPIDGKANIELIRLLAKHFHVPQNRIIIKQGITNKKKRIEILES
ncbi:MAG: DUF167 domain-containing protein [Patescibacteria group bacterium]|jgi:hypothetical protein